MKYFVVINEVQQGPYTIDELAKLNITPDTEVWAEGMKDWARTADIPELSSLFKQDVDVSQNEMSHDEKAFFAVIDDEQQGPFSIEELANMGITPETEVWTDSMEEWDKACNVPLLDEIFATEDNAPLDNDDSESSESLDDSSGKSRKISKKTILAISGVVLLLIVMMITNPSKHDHAEKVVRNGYTIMFGNDNYESAVFKGFYGNGWDNWIDRSNYLIFSICKHKISNVTMSFGILGMVFTFDDWFTNGTDEIKAMKQAEERRLEAMKQAEERRLKAMKQAESHSFTAKSINELSAATTNSYIPEGSALSYSLIEEWSLALSRERLRAGQLDGIDSEFLKLMRNSVYARHGYRFKMERFSSFFNNYDWYSPRKDDVTSEMSEIEKYNVNFIKKYE